MLPFGMALVWAGYGLGSWGWILVKGYNITLREWFSPLHPYTWPASTSAAIPRVPQGHLLPTASTTAATGTTAPHPPAAVQ